MHIQYSSDGGRRWRWWLAGGSCLLVVIHISLFLYTAQLLPTNNLVCATAHSVQCTAFNLKIFGILRCSGIFDHFIPNWITVIVPRVMHSECMFESNLCTTLTFTVKNEPIESSSSCFPSRSIYLFLSVIVVVVVCCSLYRLQSAPLSFLLYDLSKHVSIQSLSHSQAIIVRFLSLSIQLCRSDSVSVSEGEKEMPPTQKVRRRHSCEQLMCEYGINQKEQNCLQSQ